VAALPDPPRADAGTGDLQSPQERDRLDGLYECILWRLLLDRPARRSGETRRSHGPAALLQAWRFLADSRDEATDERLDALDGPYRLFPAQHHENCVEVCPKGLNPTKAIGHIKALMVKKAI